MRSTTCPFFSNMFFMMLTGVVAARCQLRWVEWLEWRREGQGRRQRSPCAMTYVQSGSSSSSSRCLTHIPTNRHTRRRLRPLPAGSWRHPTRATASSTRRKTGFTAGPFLGRSNRDRQLGTTLRGQQIAPVLFTRELCQPVYIPITYGRANECITKTATWLPTSPGGRFLHFLVKCNITSICS